MSSNFAFLEKYWPELAQIGSAAESYLYSDQNACVYKIGILCERIVTKIFNYEKIQIPEDSRLANMIKTLKYADIIPDAVDNMLYSIRKARNNAVHASSATIDDAKVILRMGFNFACWFMEVYGDWQFKQPEFVMPEDKSNSADFKAMLDAQEAKINELTNAINEIKTLAENKTAKERQEKSKEAANTLNISDEEKLFINKENIKFDISTEPVVNYALQQNGMPIIQSIVIQNNTESDLEGVTLCVKSTPEFITPYSRTIEVVPKGNSLEIRNLDLVIDVNFLAQLTEKINGSLEITLVKDDLVLCTDTCNITILAFDEWCGAARHPEMLTCFVMPNHPEVTKLISNAADYLNGWTEDSSLDGYQSQDPKRIVYMAASVYAALQKANINYAIPPASFEVMGQRVRLVDAVVEQHMGTCLDLTLLYTSCLEAMGLNPLLILKPGHIFAGVWLDNVTFPEPVQDDPSLIAKRLASGINEIIVVECTAFTCGRTISFDAAQKAAEDEVIANSKVNCIIDIKRARNSGITPLPLRIRTDEGWKINKPELSDDRITVNPKDRILRVNIDEAINEDKSSKKIQWERKLLDLGLRNTLINMRFTSKNLMPLFVHSIDEFEDAISSNKDLALAPRPTDWHIPVTSLSFENMHDMGPCYNLIKSEFDSGRIRSALSGKQYETGVKNLYRTAKSSIEENGANTLYLALGLLKWFESAKSRKPRYAPLIMIPVDLIKKIRNQSYVIRLRDEEPQVNITLLEKLKQDFSIEITGLDPIPIDDAGLDTRKIFSIVRNAVMNQSGWDVLESAYLGIFSFSQFVMWNDIRNRADDLAKNKVVKSLMEGKLSWEAQPMVLEDNVDENDVYIPVPVDASQLFAIKEAAAGKSFVLHGPPGTGKSQTITAMIANVLAQGKRVLFVAEKMAALEVVQTRLEKMGIGAFCLEVHSNKAKKKDVLDQLRRASQVSSDNSEEEYLLKAEQIKTLREDLSKYVSALHKKQRCGFTLFELINHIEEYADAPLMSETLIKNPETFDRQQFETQIALIGQLCSAAKAVVHPHDNPLSCVQLIKYSQTLKQALPELLNSYITSIKELQAAEQDVKNAFGINLTSFSTVSETNTLLENAHIWNQTNIPKEWASVDNPVQIISGIQSMSEHYLAAIEAENHLALTWNDTFYSQDGASLLTEYSQINAKWLMPKLLGMSGFVKKLTVFSKAPINKDNLLDELNVLCKYQTEQKEAEKLFVLYARYISALFNNENTNWADIKDKAASAITIISNISGLNNVQGFIQSHLGDKKTDDILVKYTSIAKNLFDIKERVYSALEIRDNDRSNWMSTEISVINGISNNLDTLREWTIWNTVKSDVLSQGLDSIVNSYLAGTDHETLFNSYMKRVYFELSNYIVENEPVLNTFSGALFDDKVKQFKQLDEKMLDLTKQEIYFRLAANVPNFISIANKNSETGILQKAIQSAGRNLSIRKLFEQIPSLLFRLCPCMLMSPISAAQYLDPATAPFDLVIFDEASQLPTSKAVGALARGKECVIVGDPKQMPPTSFFASNVVDEENLEEEDLESILDDCLALNMPQTHLLWHYRSRHESLIAFSNSRFYENNLYTFPSTNDRKSSVSLVHVDGVFERGEHRYNKAEAAAVVNEIKRRCYDEGLSSRSIGVVTFNINQQNLIDDMLSEACATDSKLEAFVYDSSEPVFIKNLESVQGDERDVILFSIGFGPDTEGKVSMNFGPLNREGGWRRLNVAVSRARWEMVVFSTLTPEQINLSRTSAEGVAALRGFLEYASGRELPNNEYSAKSNKALNYGIAVSLKKFLESKGYSADLNVGHSTYRVDVGVVDPKDPDRYILGIMLDGQSYSSAQSTRDREISQISVLEGLGWNITRIWAMDWWDNKDKECSRILSLIESLKETPDSKVITGTNSPKEKPEVIPNIDNKLGSNFALPKENKPVSYEYIVYTYERAIVYSNRMTAEEFIDYSNIGHVATLAHKVVEKEAPISLPLLTKRVINSCSLTRAGNRIQSTMQDIIRMGDFTKEDDNGQIILWNKGQKPDEYLHIRADGIEENHRDATYIPTIEAVNAICFVLDTQGGMDTASLVREAANAMGYTRLGTNVESLFKNAVLRALDKNYIELSNNQRVMLTEEGSSRAKEIEACSTSLVQSI